MNTNFFHTILFTLISICISQSIVTAETQDTEKNKTEQQTEQIEQPEEEIEEPEEKDRKKSRKKKRFKPFRLIHKTITYPFNRVLDLMDCFRLNVGVGPGIGVNVRCTPALRLGVAIYDSLRFGIHKRNFPVYRESSLEAGICMAYIQLGDADRDRMEVGASLHLILIGADIAIDFEEVGDFFAGIFTIDHKNDDF